MLPLCIGEPLLIRKHRRVSAGSFCDMKSTTKLPPRLTTESCCARGSAKPLGSRLNASRKSGAIATDSSCQRLVPCGAQSMRKPPDQRACQRKCAHSFPPEFGSQGAAAFEPSTDDQEIVFP